MLVEGAVESLTRDDIRDQYETNVIGVVRCIQEVLPSMRKRNSGTIINVSSVLGVKAGPQNSLYASSKHALEAISSGLHQELKSYSGIRIIVVQPGLTKSKFAENQKHGSRPVPDNQVYLDQAKEFKAYREKMLPNADDPKDVAQIILKAVQDSNTQGQGQGQAASAQAGTQFRYQVGVKGESVVAGILIEPKLHY